MGTGTRTGTRTETRRAGLAVVLLARRFVPMLLLMMMTTTTGKKAKLAVPRTRRRTSARSGRLLRPCTRSGPFS